MRTTVRLEEALLERARKEAERRSVTLTALIEQGLELVLRKPLAEAKRSVVRLPVSKSRGGTLPGIDLGNTAALLDRMEDRS